MSNGVSVKNINGTIHATHATFKVVVPAASVGLLQRSLDFAAVVPVEQEAVKSGRGRRKGMKRAAKPAEAAPVAEAAPAKEKKTRAAKAPAAPADANAVPKARVADIVNGCLDRGITKKSAILAETAAAGLGAGPVSIWLTSQLKKGTIIVNGDEVSRPS